MHCPRWCAMVVWLCRACGGHKEPELYTDTHASTHLPGRGGLKNRVRVKLDDGGKSAGMGIMACMYVTQFEQDVFMLCASIVFELQEPHPHVVCAVIDSEQAISEAMGGWDVHMAPGVRGNNQHGAGWFRARGGVAGCMIGLVEQT
jgi:hypothetical protein